MREIKFRAWDKEKQFMFAPTQIEIAQGENFNKWDKWRPMAWRDELPEEGSGGIGRALGDECELMQYTGLKDKNGKEIFEGDIVEYNDFNSLRTGGHAEDKFIVGKVAFGCGMWMVEEKNGHHDLYEGLVNDEELEIIGNIYENPELLEETQNGTK